MKQAAVTKKPTIAATDTDMALKFAAQEAPQAIKNKPARDRAGTKSRAAPAASSRVFFAPDGDRRLTINLRQDLHKKLRHAAVERDTTIGEIIEKLVERHLP